MHNKCIRVYCSWGKHYKKQYESSYRMLSARPADKSVYWKIIFVFLTQNICFEYSKEPSQWDGSFEHPKHMFKSLGKEINATIGAQNILIWTYVIVHFTHLKKIFSICKNRGKYYGPRPDYCRSSPIWIHTYLFSYFSPKTYVVGIQKNRLNETVILNTQNTCLSRWERK